MDAKVLLTLLTMLIVAIVSGVAFVSRITIGNGVIRSGVHLVFGDILLGIMYIASNILLYQNNQIAWHFAGDLILPLLISTIWGDILGMIAKSLSRTSKVISLKAVLLWIVLALIPYSIINYLSMYHTLYDFVSHP